MPAHVCNSESVIKFNNNNNDNNKSFSVTCSNHLATGRCCNILRGYNVVFFSLESLCGLGPRQVGLYSQFKQPIRGLTKESMTNLHIYPICGVFYFSCLGIDTR